MRTLLAAAGGKEGDKRGERGGAARFLLLAPPLISVGLRALSALHILINALRGFRKAPFLLQTSGLAEADLAKGIHPRLDGDALFAAGM